MKTILITGGNGFIGSHFVDKLSNEETKIVIVDKDIKEKKYNDKDNIVPIELDIVNYNKLKDIFIEYKFDFCIHLAAQISVSYASKNPEEDALNNILGSVNIFKLCKKFNIKKTLIASSAAVYGIPQNCPIKETDKVKPISFYGLSKYTMEEYIKLFNIDYIIARFSNVYGERQDSKGEAGVVAIFNESMKNNHDIFIFGDGLQTRDFIYVKDLAEICCNAIRSDLKNKVINISTNSTCTILELFNELKSNYSYKKNPIYKSSRTEDIRDSRLDNTIIQKHHLINKYTSFSDGIRSLYRYTNRN